MTKIILGIDPDSKAHGVAIYIDGVLVDLRSMTLMQIIDHAIWEGDITIHIEDVCANNAAFSKKGIANKKAATAINRSIGKCQQAQIELERFFEGAGVKVVKHKISSMWKKDKAQFERVTGWKGRSNEDTRSASWFGYLGLK